MTNLSIADRTALLHSHSQTFADAWFADLQPVYVEINPVSPVIDFAMNAGVFLLGVAPVLTVLFFALS